MSEYRAVLNLERACQLWGKDAVSMGDAWPCRGTFRGDSEMEAAHHVFALAGLEAVKLGPKWTMTTRAGRLYWWTPEVPASVLAESPDAVAAPLALLQAHGYQLVQLEHSTPDYWSTH